MKRLLYLLLMALPALAEELPPASLILASARAQLPPHPVVMSGQLKQKAANGFVKKTLAVEMVLHWGAEPPQATYRISDPESQIVQTLEIRWARDIIETAFFQDGQPAEYEPHAQIADSGVTWADLSFSFLWSPDAITEGIERKFGKERYQIAIPRPDEKTLRLWIEKGSGRLSRAEETDAADSKTKVIRVVSVKNFNDLWMVKDLDIIQPQTGERASLRIDEVRAGAEE